MSTRRPIASPRSTALPTLVALLAAGVCVEGCITDAHAQTPPHRDGGVHRPPHLPPTRPLPPIPPAGGVPPVRPDPLPLPPTPTPTPTPTPSGSSR